MCDLVAEAIISASDNRALGATQAGLARLWIACTARASLLGTLAVLAYLNTFQGRAISLGKMDYIVWLPTVLSLVPGYAIPITQAPFRAQACWIALSVWTFVLTAVVSFCFARFIFNIVRVRRRSKQEQRRSEILFGGPPARTRTIPSISTERSRHFLPLVQTNGSSWSLDFLDGSRSRCDQAVEGESCTVPPPTLDAARVSNGATSSSISTLILSPNEVHPRRDDDASIHARHRSASGESWMTEWTWPSTAEIESSAFSPRRNQQADLQEAQESANVSGAQVSRAVELSSVEARGAIKRIGGHLLSCVLLYVSQ